MSHLHPELNQGENNGRAKLTESMVVQMRALRAAGHSYAALGRSFGVTLPAARYAVIGVTWPNVGAKGAA